MSERHTQGEMVFEDKRPSCNGFSLFVGDQYVAFIGDSDSVTDAIANSERMAACWNACQGINTADLKAGSVSIIHKLHDEAARRVLAHRDELLAALQGILGYFDSGNSVAVSQATIKAGSDEVKAARAAIAKAEGGA